MISVVLAVVVVGLFLAGRARHRSVLRSGARGQADSARSDQVESTLHLDSTRPLSPGRLRHRRYTKDGF